MDQLELIFITKGETYDEDLGCGVGSPGDLDGGGYSEVFAAGVNGVKMYRGGNPAADTLPDKIYPGYRYRLHFLNDLNGDGVVDLSVGTRVLSQASVNLYLSQPNFYSKSEPDLILNGDYWQTFGGRVRSYDADCDGISELIVSYQDRHYPIDGSFFKYEIIPVMDTLPDDSLVIPYNLETTPIKTIYSSGDCVGDVNGDGCVDYVVSPFSAEDTSYINIYLGTSHTDSIPDYTFYTPFIDQLGEGEFGYSISPLGDIDKDGFDDFIVTSYSYPPCIYYGGDPLDSVPKILEYPGTVANTCGDINDDGWEDIAVGFTSYAGGSGAVFVYFGSSDMDTIADIFMPYDYSVELHFCFEFGKAVGSAGDFNGDGVDDLAVGADISINQNFNKGFLFVFAGDSNLPTGADEVTEGEPLPTEFNILRQNYPNPFNNRTNIEYELHGVNQRHVEVTIINILGQTVRTLVNESQSGGTHIINWDGRDNDGSLVPSGVYFYVLDTDGQRLNRKLLLLK